MLTESTARNKLIGWKQALCWLFATTQPTASLPGELCPSGPPHHPGHQYAHSASEEREWGSPLPQANTPEALPGSQLPHWQLWGEQTELRLLDSNGCLALTMALRENHSSGVREDLEVGGHCPLPCSCLEARCPRGPSMSSHMQQLPLL